MSAMHECSNCGELEDNLTAINGGQYCDGCRPLEEANKAVCDGLQAITQKLTDMIDNIPEQDYFYLDWDIRMCLNNEKTGFDWTCEPND